MALPMPGPVPHSATRARQVWSLGGGKGGIGKSLLTASLGWQLARMGKRVVLVDGDLGGANLHTCLGMAPPELTLGDFIHRRVERMEDVAVEAGHPGLHLISGASDFLGAANINYQQKVRVLNRVRSLDVDIVLMDLGAGTSYNIIDFFLASELALLAVVPEPTSIENGYRFIKGALYRRLRNAVAHDAARRLVDSALDPKNPLGIRSPLDLLAHARQVSAEFGDAFEKALGAFRPRFIVNQVRSQADIAVGHQLVAACSRHLGLQAAFAGFVHHDDAVWQAVRKRRLFMADAPGSRAAEEIRQLARGLLHGECLALPW